MNIVMVASECTPFFKTGGLADVIGSLPSALAERGHTLSVFLPKHASLPAELTEHATFLESFDVRVKWRKQYGGLYLYQKEEISYYFIDNEYYFNRPALYGENDDAERYAFFTHACLEAFDRLQLAIDILHCHDWQTGLLPAYLHQHRSGRLPKTVFTIHNLKYQGVFPLSVFDELLHFRESDRSQLEMNGAINFMKTALLYADWITTVSPSYAREILQHPFGEGLESILAQRQPMLSGILNGIDEKSYHPGRDQALYQTYTRQPARKQLNKVRLQQELGLPVLTEAPLFVMISRLVEEKGIPLLLAVVDQLLSSETMQLVILGEGDPLLANALQNVAARYPDSFRFIGEFNESLARRLYAGSDFLLMPSRFEPCGLSQLIALRYETVPIVRETGGLKDTIRPFNECSGEGNGFSFTHYRADDFLHTIRYAIHQYGRPEKWRQLQLTMYNSRLGWNQSAGAYEQLYNQLLSEEADTYDEESG
ncbi:glycogen synthase [Alkalihalobacillus oceani]|uniref:Glycogen synthase n=1 Tax=Halalkalibacter oceani TaxID=1653776 RepID=A0A9X2DKW6_9BACI|nr:glycogen/starch synthase [Halalkalibacter oceani]MCM3712584.1 glycogen synthase [Halalkalibacter oceani]